jgi:hypothetical protein
MLGGYRVGKSSEYYALVQGRALLCGQAKFHQKAPVCYGEAIDVGSPTLRGALRGARREVWRCPSIPPVAHNFEPAPEVPEASP